MPDDPTTWIGVAVLALVLMERFADRFMRWKERRPGNPGNPGNPNGPKVLTQRLDGFGKRLDSMEKEQTTMSEKISKVDRAVGSIEGQLKAARGGG